MADIPWLVELISEFPVKTKDGRYIRTPDQVQRLKNIYAFVDQDTMLDAVYRYIRVGHYFPKPADLEPHVIAAQESARGNISFQAEDEVIYYGRWRSDHAERVTDDELYAMEAAREWKT